MTDRAMYERTYGYLYTPGATVTQIAASVRRTIKTLVKADLLPADWTYSVRKRSHNSIDVTATAPRAIWAAEPDTYDHPWAMNAETGKHVHALAERRTVEARMVHDTIKDLLDGHNHNGSETQMDYFDVKFYGNVHLHQEGRDWQNPPDVLTVGGAA